MIPGQLCAFFEMKLLGKISEQMLKSILGPLFIKCESPRGPLSREKIYFCTFLNFSVLFDQKIWDGALINILLQPSFRPGITGFLFDTDQVDDQLFEKRKKSPVIPGFDTFGTIFIFNQTKG